MADRMAMAMAEGKLDEFLESEMPDSEHAKKLAEMMMGMTGMMASGETHKRAASSEKVSGDKKEAASPDNAAPPAGPPEGVVDAVKNADVKGLMDLLEQEHRKRQGGKTTKTRPGTEEQKNAGQEKKQASVEKQVLDQLLKISADNGLDLDWVVFRALKRYVEEYRKTGSL